VFVSFHDAYLIDLAGGDLKPRGRGGSQNNHFHPIVSLPMRIRPVGRMRLWRLKTRCPADKQIMAEGDTHIEIDHDAHRMEVRVELNTVQFSPRPRTTASAVALVAAAASPSLSRTSCIWGQ
jgi:hypothetical protein